MGWSYFRHLVTFTVGGFFYSLIKTWKVLELAVYKQNLDKQHFSDALVTFFGDCSALRCENLSLDLSHHGEHSFPPSACGGHYVFTHEDIVFLRRAIHFSFLCAGQDSDCSPARQAGEILPVFGWSFSVHTK